MTISLLIPVCDYDIIAFVHSMKGCIGKIPELIEIIIGDDGSSAEYRERYRTLEGDGVKLLVSEENIGRSAIRNKLVLESKGDYLLFVDADAMFTGTAEAYINRWIKVMGSARVICGGIIYHESVPVDPDRTLRWKHGRKLEQAPAAVRNKHPYASFSTFNVLIDRTIFEKLRFNEELRQYGFEDSLLSYQLDKAGILILHTDNGLVHEGLESNRDFLVKTKLGIENLSKLYDNVTDKRTFAASVRILRIYNWLRILRLSLIATGIYIRFREKMELKLDSSDPSLLLFRFYRLCMFCTYREIHSRKKTIPVF